MENIKDYKTWLREVAKRGIPVTFIPCRFGKWAVLGHDDKGNWLPPTLDEVNAAITSR